MSAINILDRIHLPHSGHRLLAQAPIAIGRACTALRDHVSGLREMAASTMLAYGAVVAMSLMVVHDLLSPTQANSSFAVMPESRAKWVEIARPHAAFALQSPALDGLSSTYKVQRHRTGGGRRDEMTFGDTAGDGAYVRLSLYRPGAEGIAEPDPFQAVVALASESSIDAELLETNRKISTKFGALPVVDMKLRSREGARTCLATAAGWSDPRLGMTAWWCNPGPELVAQGEFACLLDRLALMSSGNDSQLAEFFARAELNRSFCNLQTSFVSPTPHRVDDWLSARREPQLRGRLPAR